jgi:glycosyltransferase involved in cell wall biosynthesis
MRAHLGAWPRSEVGIAALESRLGRVESERAIQDMRVALVHDYLTQKGGAERVVLALCRAFPDAPLYTSLYDPATTFPEFQDHEVRPLWLDRVSPLRRRHRLALPLLPLVFSTSRVDADVVVCSSSGWAHGVRTGGRKIVYCHSPAKWLYRRRDYLGEHPSEAAKVGLRLLDPYLRRFDRRAAASANIYIANSTFVSEQIRAAYGIDAEVLHPPASLGADGPAEAVPGIEPGFLLTVARLLPYKHVSETVAAFRLLANQRLVVVGEGPGRAALQASLPDNVRLLGEATDARLRWLYANCAGLVAASREDFGLTPVEAAAFGKPVAALRFGGFFDTVVVGVNGLLFERPEPGAIAEAVEALLGHDWDEGAIRRHADAFSEERFIQRIQSSV